MSAEWNPGEWAARAAKLYPEIESLYLVGSRASGEAGPESDWDVVAVLSDACYGDVGALDNLERRITEDSSLAFEGLDLFFLRPGDRHFRWNDGTLEEVPMFGTWLQEGPHALRLCGKRLANDEPVGSVPLDEDRSLIRVRSLSRGGHTGATGRNETVLDGDPAGGAETA